MQKIERRISELMDEYGFTSFEKGLYTDPYSYNKDKNKLEERLELIENSTSRDDFISKVLEITSPSDSSNGQLYAVFSKLAYGHTKRLKKYLDEIKSQSFATYSEVGSVRVGNDDFSIQISNGRGDGETHVYIVDGRTNTSMFDPWMTTFQGKNFKVSDHDCFNVWLDGVELNGHYFAHCYNGVVCIEKFRNLEE